MVHSNLRQAWIMGTHVPGVIREFSGLELGTPSLGLSSRVSPFTAVLLSGSLVAYLNKQNQEDTLKFRWLYRFIKSL